jgi:hypothetical protein
MEDGKKRRWVMAKDFESWMREVDEAVWRKAGCSVHDLPDCCFRDWFEAKVTVKGAASRAIKAAKDK